MSASAAFMSASTGATTVAMQSDGCHGGITLASTKAKLNSSENSAPLRPFAASSSHALTPAE